VLFGDVDGGELGVALIRIFTNKSVMNKVIVILFIGLLWGCSSGVNPSPYFRFNPTPDTLTLGANDTLAVTDLNGGAQFWGELYGYNLTLQATQVGDTASTVIVILQESNEHNGSNWYELERDTVATGATLRLHGGSNTTLGYVKGENLRILIDDVGGSGEDTTVYNLDLVIKKL